MEERAELRCEARRTVVDELDGGGVCECTHDVTQREDGPVQRGPFAQPQHLGVRQQLLRAWTVHEREMRHKHAGLVHCSRIFLQPAGYELQHLRDERTEQPRQHRWRRGGSHRQSEGRGQQIATHTLSTLNLAEIGLPGLRLRAR
jgi:hypothetical protein